MAALILSLSGCNPPENEEQTTTTAETTVSEAPAETTTSSLGGFIVYDMLPEDEISWEEFSE